MTYRLHWYAFTLSSAVAVVGHCVTLSPGVHVVVPWLHPFVLQFRSVGGTRYFVFCVLGLILVASLGFTCVVLCSAEGAVTSETRPNGQEQRSQWYGQQHCLATKT